MNDDPKSALMPRRRFVKLAGLAAGAALAGGAYRTTFVQPPVTQRVTAPQQPHRHQRPLHRPLVKDLEPFVDALPIPATMPVARRIDGVALYDVAMVPFTQKLHRDLAPTTLWGYHGAFPGPTFEARRGEPMRVLWRNALPARHALPIDTSIHGAGPDMPAVRTVVHVHGLKVLPENDGYPDAWFTSEFAQTGPFFRNRIYDYPNDQRAATLWYHDHAIGLTRLNNYMGLTGMYILRDDIEDALNLPSGPYEIPLIIQDRNLAPDGSLVYPDPASPAGTPEFFGESVLVNGKIWPFLTVEPRKYRFRILNASNARFYRLALVESDQAGNPTGNRGPRFAQIGSDGGLLSEPVSRASIIAAPAERFDVIIDFSDHAGNTFVLANDARAPFPDGDDVIPARVMMFKVSRELRSPDVSSLPHRLPAVTRPDISDVVQTRDLVLTEVESEVEDKGSDQPIMSLINDARWDDPITERPTAGSTEIWRIINRTDDAHPIHVHLVQCQILDRRPFDDDRRALVFTGPSILPPDDERFGLKDTVVSFPGEVVRLLIKFDLPTGARVRRDETFTYTFHCHILEHEDNQMMRPYIVVGGAGQTL